jgi:flagellar protein FlaJ
VKSLGLDMVTALEKAANRTPSPTFGELLWGMVSVLTTGGDMESYLQGKTRSAMAQYRRTLNDYAKAIAFYTEIYITLVIVGSLFFIILLSIISPLVGGSTLFLQTFLVFFFIPLVSMGFIMLLKGASPIE